MGDFVIRRWELAPYDGDQAPLHVHHVSDEGFAVVRGHLVVQVGDERQLLGAGDSVVVAAGTVHTFATVDDEPAVVLAVMTPEVDALVTALHQVGSDAERREVWRRFRSEPV